MNEPIVITQSEKQKALQSSVYHLCDRETFYGGLLQELCMKYSEQLPTAGITFNKEQSQFEIYINPKFFCSLTTDQRVAVLHHEILHFTNKHLFRLPFLTAKEEDRKLYNIAGDMSINQYIKNLPDGCVDVKDWKYEVPSTSKGKKPTIEPFPLLQSMETYYDLIKNNKEINKDKLKDYKEFDVHDWDEMDDITKQKMLDEAKKVVRRTVEKSTTGHTKIPDSIQDLLKEIETLAATLSYKDILKRAIKKTVCAVNREGTWKKPNKRYGAVAQGSKISLLPRLFMYIDSSGSISHVEMNEFLNVVSGFLKIGARECTLLLWHTSVYYKTKYKLHGKLENENIQSGGTDLDCVFTSIKQCNPNLSIILTDGYYDSSSIPVTNEVVFIISKGGNQNHPMAHIGKTVMLEGLK